MTPDELLILFSSYVIAFLLVRFANFADRVGHPEAEAAHGAEQEQSLPAVQHSRALDWNVATFFGLRRGGEKRDFQGKPD
jgi:hypothetical protein